MSEVEGLGEKSTPLAKMENRVEYMKERGRQSLNQARRKYWNWENWGLFCRVHPSEGSFRRKRGVKAIESRNKNHVIKHISVTTNKKSVVLCKEY